MKILTALLMLFAAFMLSGCDGEVFDYAYTASGEGSQESDLREDAQFSGTDDLNVVVKLKQHDQPVQVEVRFIDPNGDALETIQAEADSDTGTLVMGIDFDARADQGGQWSRGRYTVQVLIDGEQVQTLYFRVD